MRRIKETPILGAAAAAVLTGVFHLGEVGAHSGATGVVKERMDLMKSMGERMKNMGAMVKGKEPFDAADIAASADEIQRQAAEIHNLFPEGSLQKVSEALPRIWVERQKFDVLTDKLVMESHNLSQIAITGDRREITKQFVRIGKICSSCHTDYRKKKD